MRGLAEYAMSGRRQAATVAVLFGLIPVLNLLSGAVVALVTLRKGPQEGLLIMMWALLPAGAQWLIGDTTPVIMVIGVMLLAWLLRRTQSWQHVLVFTTLLGVVVQLALPLSPEYAANAEQMLDAALQQNAAALSAEGVTPEEAKAGLLPLWMSMYGTVYVMVFSACLMIGRSWQAQLYNPGGFQQEFHNLRLPPRVMLVLVVLFGLGLTGFQPFIGWTFIFTVAPILCGLALVHYVVAVRKLGVGVLVLTYLVALIMTPLIIIVGLADSLFDIRKRIRSNVAN
jgi:hypothetical protein